MSTEWQKITTKSSLKVHARLHNMKEFTRRRRDINVQSVRKDSSCLMTSKGTIAFTQESDPLSVKNVRKDLE